MNKNQAIGVFRDKTGALLANIGSGRMSLEKKPVESSEIKLERCESGPGFFQDSNWPARPGFLSGHQCSLPVRRPGPARIQCLEGFATPHTRDPWIDVLRKEQAGQANASCKKKWDARLESSEINLEGVLKRSQRVLGERTGAPPRQGS